VFCGVAAGLGFSIQESLYYFASSGREISDVIILATRTLTTSLMHAMATALVGIGILLARKHRRLAWALVPGFFLLAIALHALYNLLLATSLAPFVLLVPLLMFFAIWVLMKRLGE